MRQSNPSARAAPGGEAVALYIAACQSWREGRRDEAIVRLDEALRRWPDFAEALSMGGYMLSQCGKPEAALRFYRQALALDPSLVVAHAQRRQAPVRHGPVRGGARFVSGGDVACARRRRRLVQSRRRVARVGAPRGFARSRRTRSRSPARLRRGRDQPRQCASEARPHGGGARRLSPGRRFAPRFRRGPVRRGPGAAQSRPVRGGARGVRGGRGARQPRGRRRERLPSAYARRFRTRLRRVRGALA